MENRVGWEQMASQEACCLVESQSRQEQKANWEAHCLGCQDQLEVEGSQSQDPKARQDRQEQTANWEACCLVENQGCQEQMEAGDIQSQDLKASQEIQGHKTAEANQVAQGQKASQNCQEQKANREVHCLVESRGCREQKASWDPKASWDFQDQLKVVENQSRNQANLEERQCLLLEASRGQKASLEGWSRLAEARRKIAQTTKGLQGQ